MGGLGTGLTVQRNVASLQPARVNPGLLRSDGAEEPVGPVRVRVSLLLPLVIKKGAPSGRARSRSLPWGSKSRKQSSGPSLSAGSCLQEVQKALILTVRGGIRCPACDLQVDSSFAVNVFLLTVVFSFFGVSMQEKERAWEKGSGSHRWEVNGVQR